MFSQLLKTEKVEESQECQEGGRLHALALAETGEEEGSWEKAPLRLTGGAKERRLDQLRVKSGPSGLPHGPFPPARG